MQPRPKWCEFFIVHVLLIMKYEEGQNPRLIPIKAHEAMSNRSSDVSSLKVSRIYSISHEIHWVKNWSIYNSTNYQQISTIVSYYIVSLFINHMAAGYEIS